MQEMFLAIHLHMFMLPKNENGETHYHNIISKMPLDPKKEKVFIKAKGVLYLDELSEKRRDRLFAFVIGFLSAYLVELLKLPLQF